MFLYKQLFPAKKKPYGGCMQKNDPITKFFKLAIGHLPRVQLSRLAGWMALPQRPHFFRKITVPWFVEKFNIDMSEAELPIEQYPSVSELFVRKLRPGLRPIGPGIVHPVDGTCVDSGVIETAQVFQAKGKTYDFNDFLVQPEALHQYKGGRIITYYLSPQDYHHVHFPVDCQVLKIQKQGYDLWPVNPWSLSKHSQVFVKNERVILTCQASWGIFELVMVGAVVVGQILIQVKVGQRYQKGDHVGYFQMGSTVVMVYPPQCKIDPVDKSEKKVKYGQTLTLI